MPLRRGKQPSVLLGLRIGISRKGDGGSSGTDGVMTLPPLTLRMKQAGIKTLAPGSGATR